MTPNRRGSSVRQNSVSLVRYPASASPSMGGAAALPPVAMTARANRNVWPPTRTASLPTNRASPRKTSTPSFLKRLAESCAAIPERRRRMRSMTDPKSTFSPTETSTPKAPASRASATAREERMSALEGTHPTLRQSPPKRCFSIRAQRAPRPVAPAAETSPAVPPPMATRL